MTTALLTGLADAIVADLNAVTWTPTFTAVRKNVPTAKREDMASLQVSVTPHSKSGTAITRSKQQYSIECYVLLQKGLTTDTNAETDPLILLGESIAARYAQGKVLTIGSLSVTCVGAVFGADEDTSFLSVARQQESLEYFGAILLRFMAME